MFKLCRCLAFLLCINALHGWKSYNVLFNNISSNANPQFLELHTSIGSNKQTFDMFITVQNVLPLFNLTFEVLMSPPSENRFTTLFNRTLPYCDFAMGKYFDPIVKLIYDEFKNRGGQLLSKCATPVGAYRVKGFRVDTDKLPPYLPDAAFKVIISAYYLLESQRQVLYTMELYGAIDSSSSWKRLKMMAKKN